MIVITVSDLIGMILMTVVVLLAIAAGIFRLIDRYWGCWRKDICADCPHADSCSAKDYARENHILSCKKKEGK